MRRGTSPTDDAVIEHMRRRRRTYFFGDDGPSLPPGVYARWRTSCDDPHGWHANMVGAIEAPVEMVGDVLDRAIEWFGRCGADTWVDADEWSVVFHHQELVEERGFILNDDWDVMACREQQHVEVARDVTVRDVRTRPEFRVVAQIAERAERQGTPTLQEIERRTERYWREYNDWNSQFVLASLNGEPVGTARLTDEQVPVLVGVATVHEARGRGVATAVTDALTARALNTRGVCALYVERSSQAARIYARAGYRSLFRSRAWVRPFQGNEPS